MADNHAHSRAVYKPRRDLQRSGEGANRNVTIRDSGSKGSRGNVLGVIHTYKRKHNITHKRAAPNISAVFRVTSPRRISLSMILFLKYLMLERRFSKVAKSGKRVARDIGNFLAVCQQSVKIQNERAIASIMSFKL